MAPTDCGGVAPGPYDRRLMSSLRSPRSRRPVVGLLAVVALMLATSACGSAGQPPAATVDGTDISADRVDEIVGAYVAADPETYSEAFAGEGDDTLSMNPVSNVLSSLIVQVLQSDLAADRGVTPTDEERTQAEEAVRTSFVQQEQADPADPAATEPSESEAASGAIFDELSESTQKFLIDLQADSIALSRQLGEESGSGDAAAQEYYDQNPDQFKALCLRLLALPEADLPTAQARLEAGEDFETVSRELSTPPEVIQSLDEEPQCQPLSTFQQQLQAEAFEQLASAVAGDVVGPFAYDEEGNVVLVEVPEVRLTPFEEVRELILQNIPAAGDQALNDLVTSTLAEADVSVDPRFGTWETDRGVDPTTGTPLPAGVVPPVVPGATTTTTEAPVVVEAPAEGADAAQPPG